MLWPCLPGYGQETAERADSDLLNFFFRSDRAERTLVQHGDAIRDTKCAGHFVGDYNHGHLERLLQKQNQFIQFGGNNGVETGRGLIQNQNLGIEGEGAGYGCTFFHAA